MKIYDYNGKKNICGDRVHEARCRHRLTQSDLAAQLQVAGIIIERDSISRIEIGTRFVADYELRELAKILKVSVAWVCRIKTCGSLFFFILKFILPSKKFFMLILKA